MNRNLINKCISDIIDNNLINKIDALSDLLLQAAKRGYMNIVAELIQHGAKVNHTDNSNWTPLMLAIGPGDCIETTKLLINSNAEINYINSSGLTPLLLAIGSGHKEIAKLLILSGAKVNQNNGWSALMLAANFGYMEITRLLIKHGANIKHTTNSGRTALMSASQSGHLELAKLLISKGAVVDYSDYHGNNALAYADKKGSTELAKILVLGTHEMLKKYYSSNNLAIATFLSNGSPYLANIKRLISIRVSTIKRQFYMIMTISGLQSKDCRFSQPFMPRLSIDLWKKYILPLCFTNIFIMKDGKLHLSKLGNIPSESFVINRNITNMIRIWAEIEFKENTIGFKIVCPKIF